MARTSISRRPLPIIVVVRKMKAVRMGEAKERRKGFMAGCLKTGQRML